MTRTKDNHSLDRFREKKPKRWWRVVLFLILAVALWYGSTIFLALKRATTPNVTTGSSLLKEATSGQSGPINVLLIGIGGQSHPGGTLADSIIVASIDVKRKTVSLLSVPRDLYVTLPNGSKEKINAAHALGENQKKQGGPAVLKEVVSETLDVPISYFIRIDFDGFKKIVDTLGGVTVQVKTPINDPFYPDAKLQGYEPFSISAGTHKLDGKMALKYVRSRETTSDFDRARRQQEVLTAIKDKMLSAQILANPKKVTDIITVLGKHILTDFSVSEIEDLIKLAKELDNPTINQHVLGNGDTGLLLSSRSPSGASILIPKAGMNNFSQIQHFANAYFASPGIQSEKATIRLESLPGVTKETVSQIEQELKWAGFEVNVSNVSNASETKSVLYDYTENEKPNSLAYLSNLYKVTEKKPSDAITYDFVFILGPDIASFGKKSLNSKKEVKLKSSQSFPPSRSVRSLAQDSS